MEPSEMIVFPLLVAKFASLAAVVVADTVGADAGRRVGLEAAAVGYDDGAVEYDCG